MTSPDRTRTGLLAFAISLSFFVQLGGAPLFDRDEGAFGQATREMVASGDFVSTTLNGEPRYDKPILTYWAQAAGAALLGWNEWGVRIPSAVAALLWVLAVSRFGRRTWDDETGWAAAMLTATTLWVVIIGRAATADALLNLFVALSMFDGFRFWTSGDPGRLRRAFLWTALGALTKGPIAVFIPAAVVITMAVLRRRPDTLRRAVSDPVAWLLFLCIVGPWYGAAWAHSGTAFIDGFFLQHNLGRFARTMEGHGGHLWYYVPVILLVLLPHTTLFLKTVPRLRHAPGREIDLFLWTWFLVVFVFFSFSATQLPHYVLHGATPLFLLMARQREELRSAPLALLPVLVLAALLFFLPDLWRLGRPLVDDAFTLAMMTTAPDAFDLGYRAWTGLGLAAAVGLLFVPGWAVWHRLLAGGFVTAGLVSLAVFPAWGEIQQGPTKQAALEARRQGWDVVMSVDMPSFAFYYGAITPFRAPAPGEVVFTRVTRLDQVGTPTEVLWQRGGVVLARVGGVE